MPRLFFDKIRTRAIWRACDKYIAIYRYSTISSGFEYLQIHPVNLIYIIWMIQVFRFSQFIWDKTAVARKYFAFPFFFALP